MPISNESYFRYTYSALKVIREVDVPRHIKENRRECVNCIYWNSSDEVTGFCKCNGDLADYKNLRTLYSETCCYCMLEPK